MVVAELENEGIYESDGINQQSYLQKPISTVNVGNADQLLQLSCAELQLICPSHSAWTIGAGAAAIDLFERQLTPAHMAQHIHPSIKILICNK